MKIKVKVKNVYGNELFYPVCDKAKAFAALVGSKTLTPASLVIVRRLGYTIVLV